MRKERFLRQLRKELSSLNKREQTSIIRYYDEMIQDAIDDGENESEFISSLGSPESIVRKMTNENYEEEPQVRRKSYSSSPHKSSGNVLTFIVHLFVVLVYIAVCLFILSFAFSLFTASFSIIYYGVSNAMTTYSTSQPTAAVYGLIAFGGIGVFFISIGFFSLMISFIKNNVMHQIRSILE